MFVLLLFCACVCVGIYFLFIVNSKYFIATLSLVIVISCKFGQLLYNFFILFYFFYSSKRSHPTYGIMHLEK